MNDPKIISAAELEDESLYRSFKSFFGEKKGEFLRRYGKWWYRGYESILIVTVGEEIGAHGVLIPTKCIIKGKEHRAAWLVDLFTSEEFRGQGLQHLLDEEMCQKNDLVLGFPNELAAGIHLKHGWGVRRSGKVLMLPLRPTEIKSVRLAKGFRGKVLRISSKIMSPAFRLSTYKRSRYSPRFAYSAPSPDFQIMAKVFERYMDETVVTTCRDADFLKWRYLDAPYRSELTFYMAGPSASPTHFLISRNLKRQGSKVTRILDICGDLHDDKRLRDLIRIAVKDAIDYGSCQVTVMAWTSELISVLRSIGFLISTKTLFCWHSKAEDMMRMLNESECYWTLGDSDNDEP